LCPSLTRSAPTHDATGPLCPGLATCSVCSTAAIAGYGGRGRRIGGNEQW
jgi:hypothetical protein